MIFQSSHQFMQGRQYSKGEGKTVNGVYYPSAEEKGVYDRLYKDYNCYHEEYGIILGVSVPVYSEKQLAELNARDNQTYNIGGKERTRYECGQMMRNLETEIRKQKGIKAAALASGDRTAVLKANERIKACKTKYNEITGITGLDPQPRRMQIGKVQENLQNTVDFSGNGGIMDTGRSFSSRNMANSGRKSVYHTLNKDEVELIKSDIKAIGADESIFKINEGTDTYYDDKYDVIFVRGNILPDLTSQHPRDLMSSRAVLAHEYYGHRAHKETKLLPKSWNDEFRASYTAAKITPNLSYEDRRYLILDAIERAKEAGVAIKYSNYIRRMLYE